MGRRLSIFMLSEAGGDGKLMGTYSQFVLRWAEFFPNVPVVIAQGSSKRAASLPFCIEEHGRSNERRL